MSKKVEVWLLETSEPIVHIAKNTYTKGPFYCVYCDDGKVHKYPVINMFKAIEGYGTHGGEKVGFNVTNNREEKETSDG